MLIICQRSCSTAFSTEPLYIGGRLPPILEKLVRRIQDVSFINMAKLLPDNLKLSNSIDNDCTIITKNVNNMSLKSWTGFGASVLILQYPVPSLNVWQISKHIWMWSLRARDTFRTLTQLYMIVNSDKKADQISLPTVHCYMAKEVYQQS